MYISFRTIHSYFSLFYFFLHLDFLQVFSCQFVSLSIRCNSAFILLYVAHLFWKWVTTLQKTIRPQQVPLLLKSCPPSYSLRSFGTSRKTTLATWDSSAVDFTTSRRTHRCGERLVSPLQNLLYINVVFNVSQSLLCNEINVISGYHRKIFVK